MKKISIIALSVCALAFSSCKKSSSSAPSIVGQWSFSNVTGTVTSNTSTTNGSVTTYSYNSATTSVIASVALTGSTIVDSATTKVTTEIWTFNADGTYTINENYTHAPNTALTSTSSGTWQYLSNSKTNDAVILLGYGSNVLGNTGSDDVYTFQIVGNTLVLTYTDAQTDNSGATHSDNLTWTFTKQ